MYYNQERLHSAIGYVTPKDTLEGREPVLLDEASQHSKTDVHLAGHGVVAVDASPPSRRIEA